MERALSQDPRRLQVRLGAGEVVELAVQLGQADVQVGGGPRVRLAVPGRGRERLLVQPAGAAGSPGGDPHVGEHDRGVQLVDQVSRCVQAADRLGERGERLLDVAGRPGGQAEEPARPAPHEVVLGAGQVERVPGVAHRAGDVAPGLGQGGAVDQDRRRRGAQVLGVRPRGRQVRVAGAGLQRRLGVVEPGLHPVEVAGHHPRPAGHDAQHRAAADDGVAAAPGPSRAAGCPVALRRSSGSASSIR